MKFEPVIGLEVHVQLDTKTKVFCSCSTDFGSQPNTQVCPVCLGFPGALPVLNKHALEHSIKVGIALYCQVQEFTKFDRKHYYYPDLPKNFQISQYDLPISKDGFLDIQIEAKTKRIRIRRAHLEEDAGKLIHKDDLSFVDYNRTGQPLLEIVTEPDISSPQEAYEYLTCLKSILEYLEVSDCDMEKGSLRCDANVSIRPQGTEELGTKSELKNLNSFKAVRDALEYEIQRQTETLVSGGKIIQETRLWDERSARTISMRSKEEAKDYRYFPEPDLPAVIIKKEMVEDIRKTIPELPKEKFQRFLREYEGLTENDIQTLIASRKKADDIEAKMQAWPDKNKKPVANWYIGPLAALAADLNIQTYEVKISTQDFLELIELVDKKQVISNLTGKSVLTEMAATQKSASAIIQEKNLAQVSDESSLATEIDEVIKANPKSVQDFRSGKENAVMFLVGQVMRRTKGKANPKVVQDLLKRRIQDA